MYISMYIYIYTWTIIVDDPFKHDILDMDINGNCVVHLLLLTLLSFMMKQPGIVKKTKYIMHVDILLSISIPIGSLYAIYGNIYHQYTPNVSIYTIHGSYGICIKYSENMDASSDSNEVLC